MTTVTTKLLKHYGNPGTRKDGSPYIRNDFVAEDNERYQSFDPALSTQVLGFLGQVVELSYEEKPRGQWVNKEIVAIAPVASSSAPSQEAVASTEAPVETVTYVKGEKDANVNANADIARAIELIGLGVTLDQVEAVALEVAALRQKLLAA